MSHRPADHGTEDPFDRLRAADPAAGLSPDEAALEAAVRARVGDRSPSGAPAAATDQLSAARARRNPQRWLAVAAVAAGTLAVGSVGYALGDRAGGDLTATSSSPGPITLGQPGTAGGAPEPATGAAGASTQARVATESAAADSASLPFLGGRTVFTAQGLSDETGSAEAWAYDPTRTFTAETAARLAESLGLAGEPRQEGGAWVVGAQDGTTANLQLYRDGTTSVSFYDPALDPFGCPVTEPAPAEKVVPVPEPLPDIAPDAGSDTSSDATQGGGSEPVTQLPAPDVPACTTPDLGEAPQGDAAVARAREVVAGTGADPDAYEYEVGASGDPQATYVTAHERLAGQRTGVVWSLTLVGDGVQSLFGSLAPLTPLGSYDVISPNAAVERLADPRFGSWGGPVLAAGGEAAVRELSIDPSGPATSGEAPAEATAPPAPVAAGSSFAWPVSQVTLTSARLGLAQHTQPDGATVLLPAYELSAEDGTTWSVVAVADEGLDFSAGR